jgi:hypothetical protein
MKNSEGDKMYYIMYKQWRADSEEIIQLIISERKTEKEVISFLDSLERDRIRDWSYIIVKIVKGEELKFRLTTSYKLVDDEKIEPKRSTFTFDDVDF